MSTRVKIVLFLGFLLALAIIIPVGFWLNFQYSFYPRFRIQNVLPEPLRPAAVPAVVKYTFSSELPNYTIASIDNQALDPLIKKMGLVPFVNKSFIGNLIDGSSPNQISPSEVVVTIKPMDQLNKDLTRDSTVQKRILYQEASRVVYLAGVIFTNYNTGEQKLTIPVYVNIEWARRDTRGNDIFFSEIALEAIFLNVQSVPMERLGNPTQVFREKIGDVTQPIFSGKQTFQWLRRLVRLLVPTVYAQQGCTGNITCGAWYQPAGTCLSGQNTGGSCTKDSDCPGSTCNLPAQVCQVNGSPPGGCTKFITGSGPDSYYCSALCFSCIVSGSCTKTGGGPGPTPTPTPGGGPAPGCGQCNTCGISQWCNLLSNGQCVVDSCACAGIGCGGSPPGDPCPADSCAGTCCNYNCMTQPCIVTADCKSPSTAGYTIQCLAPDPNNPIAKYCVNIMCPSGTDPGTICGCSGNTILCGNKCAGGCEPNSICTFTDPTCVNGNTTYCVGTKNPNPPQASLPYTSYNPDYVGNLCSPGAWHLVYNPTGQSSGFSQAQINSTCASATINVRGHYVSPSDISCAAINASTSYTTGTVFGLSPAVAPTTQTQSGSAYLAWTQVPANTYSLLTTPPAGAVLQNACWTRSSTAPTNGSGTSLAVAVADTVNWDIGYSLGTPWVQTKGGDVIVKDTIKSLMTSLASPRLFSVNGDGGYPGNVSYGSTGAAPYNFNADVSDTTYGRNYVSSTNWLVNEPGDGFSKDPFTTDWYQYFLYQLDLSPKSGAVADYTNPVASITKPTTPSRQTLPYVYLVSGDMTTSGDWTIGANETIVFLVSGNVTIKGKITITPGGFFALIANGNITIDPTVGVAYSSSTPVIEGFYVTSKTGSFITGQSTNVGTECFVGKGSFVAGSFLLQRDLSSIGHNADTAAELFIYNPQLLLTMPDKMKDMKITWREAAP